MVTAQRHQRIQRQRHQLQAQVDHQEVVARDHDRDAQQRKQAQGEQLALEHFTRAGIQLRVRQRGHHGQRGAQGQQVPHGVGHDHALHGVTRRLVVQVAHVQARHTRQGEHGQPVGGPTLLAGDVEIHHRHQACHAQQEDLGRHRHPVHVVHIRSAFSSACWWTRA